MMFLRRVIEAVVLGALLVGVIRLGGSGSTPLQRGGWRPLQLPGTDGVAGAGPEAEGGRP